MPLSLLSTDIDRFSDGLATLPVAIDKACQSRLLRFAELIVEWNRTYRLISRDTTAIILSRHILDSIAAAPYVRGARCLDIGSGAGLPGLPLALINPQQHWTLLDSRSRPVQFLEHARLALAMQNIEIVHNRAERHRPNTRYDTIIARGVSSLAKLCAWAKPLLLGGGALLAMKGPNWQDELSDWQGNAKALSVHNLTIPGSGRSRFLLSLEASQLAG